MKQYQLATVFSRTQVTEVEKKKKSGVTTAHTCHLNPGVFTVIWFEANKEQNEEQSIERMLSCSTICHICQRTKCVPSGPQPGSAANVNVTELLPL